MTGYTKLFSSIVTSTIWREPKETKILWITMLALANKFGVVEGSIPGLADMARLSITETEEALLLLYSPDQYSRTTEHEGRRVKAIDGGWQILNHGKYREKMNADERREYLRIKKAESRERLEKRSTAVNNGQSSSTPSTHAECRVQSADANNTHRQPARPVGIEEAIEFGKSMSYPEEVIREWFFNRDSQGWEKGNNKPITNWKSDLGAWVIGNHNRGTEGKNANHRKSSSPSRVGGSYDPTGRIAAQYGKPKGGN